MTKTSTTLGLLGLLSAMMLSTSRIEEMCAAARDAGAHGAKLTGGGRGGYMIALADSLGGGARC